MWSHGEATLITTVVLLTVASVGSLLMIDPATMTITIPWWSYLLIPVPAALPWLLTRD